MVVVAALVSSIPSHSNVLASHIDIFLGVLQVIVYIYNIFNIYIYNMLYKILNILYI